MDTRITPPPSITLFSTFKPLKDESYNISIYNSVNSWIHALKSINGVIILYEELEGQLGEFKEDDNLKVFSHDKRDKWGIPTIDRMFYRSYMCTRSSFMCFVNGDIILPPNFVDRIHPVLERNSPFMLGASPFDVICDYRIDFSNSEWYSRIRKSYGGMWRSDVAIDFFLFTSGIFHDIPPFSIGRIAYDNYLIGRGKESTGVLIDGTQGIGAIHQYHDYRPYTNLHHVMSLPASEHNKKVAGGYAKCALRQATHVLDETGLSVKER